jgi:hypothetical protein
MIEKFLPLLIMGGMAWHGKDAIKDRLASAINTPARITTKQRINQIFYTVQLYAVDDDPVARFSNTESMRKFVRARVRITNDPAADASLDSWGTPLRYESARIGFTIVSAGSDKTHGTKDDERVTQNPYDY